jgi:hypothetical protein
VRGYALPNDGPVNEADLSTNHQATLTAELAAERALADQLASHLEWALRCVGSLPMELRTTFDNRMAEVLAAHKEARRER